MLVQHSTRPFAELISSLTMKIQLTPALQDALDLERGVVDSTPFEMRGCARFRCFGKCLVTLAPSSFSMPGQEPESLAIVRDVSRTGFGIVTHQQWFPEQVLNLTLEKADITARVARVRRLGPKCYEIGLADREA